MRSDRLLNWNPNKGPTCLRQLQVPFNPSNRFLKVNTEFLGDLGSIVEAAGAGPLLVASSWCRGSGDCCHHQWRRLCARHSLRGPSGAPPGPRISPAQVRPGILSVAPDDCHLQVKSGGAVEPLGTRISLHVTGPSDMTRDVLKVTPAGEGAVLTGLVSCWAKLSLNGVLGQ